MRPPQKAGGNARSRRTDAVRVRGASMRPPQKAGGNLDESSKAQTVQRRFNEAPAKGGGEWGSPGRAARRRRGFNEAPAKGGGECLHRKFHVVYPSASMRPPQKAGGNYRLLIRKPPGRAASMRPPQKAGGNPERRSGTDRLAKLQ